MRKAIFEVSPICSLSGGTQSVSSTLKTTLSHEVRQAILQLMEWEIDLLL